MLPVRLKASFRTIPACVALFAALGIHSAALAIPPPLQAQIQGAVTTIAQGWSSAWITTCPQIIKIGSGVFGGVRNDTAYLTNITWQFYDETTPSTAGAQLIDAELPGLDPGKIVTMPFPGQTFQTGLVFECNGGTLPATPAGLLGPILVSYR